MKAVEAPYVDVWEALRRIAAKLPGGTPHAAVLTDGLIKKGVAFGLSMPDGSETLAVFQAAIGLLKRAIQFPDVRMTVETNAGRRPVADDERAYRLEIREGLLVEPFGKSSGPLLRGILICVADLERTVRQLPPVDEQIDLKAFLANQLQVAGGDLPQVDAVKIARKEGIKATREEIRETLKTVGGATKSGPKGPRKNRAKPAA